ncbi:hypothetical protein ACEN2D_06535 [Corynebacterium auriscanis]
MGTIGRMWWWRRHDWLDVVVRARSPARGGGAGTIAGTWCGDRRHVV